MLQVSRRGLLGMFAAGVSAAIVRPGLVMPIKPALASRPVVDIAKTMSLLEDYAQVDAALSHTILYGDASRSPREFTGFAVFPLDQHARHVLDARRYQHWRLIEEKAVALA